MKERDIQNELYRRYDLKALCCIPNFAPPDWWECDLMTVSKAGYISEFEIKLSKSDYRADFKKKNIWGTSKGALINKFKHDLLSSKDCIPKHYWFVVPIELEGLDFPDYAGVLIAKQLSDNSVYIRQVKKAPKLSKKKASELTMKRILTSLSHRYWMKRR